MAISRAENVIFQFDGAGRQEAGWFAGSRFLVSILPKYWISEHIQCRAQTKIGTVYLTSLSYLRATAQARKEWEINGTVFLLSSTYVGMWRVQNRFVLYLEQKQIVFIFRISSFRRGTGVHNVYARKCVHCTHWWSKQVLDYGIYINFFPTQFNV